MGLSFRRLLLFEGLFEVASLGPGSLARQIFVFLSFRAKAKARERSPLLWQAINYSASHGGPPSRSILKEPPGKASFTPARPQGARARRCLTLYSNLPAVSRRLAVACLSESLSSSGKPRSSKVEGCRRSGGLRGGGWMAPHCKNSLCSGAQRAVLQAQLARAAQLTAPPPPPPKTQGLTLERGLCVLCS